MPRRWCAPRWRKPPRNRRCSQRRLRRSRPADSDDRAPRGARSANEVATTLDIGGARVDVRHIADIADITQYDRIVVGGAIQYDRWMAGASNFVHQNRTHLATIPVAFFFTCLALSKPGAESLGTAAGYERKIRSIAPEIQPLSLKGFAGVLDYSRMTPVTRIVARFLLTLRGPDAGDHRQWTHITTWARSLKTGAASD